MGVPGLHCCASASYIVSSGSTSKALMVLRELARELQEHQRDEKRASASREECAPMLFA